MDIFDTISLKEAIAVMDGANEFSIGFRTYNDRQQTGGEFIEIKRAAKHLSFKMPSNGSEPAASNHPGSKKNPNHFENATRNIKNIQTGDILKLHLDLIVFFNNKQVI